MHDDATFAILAARHPGREHLYFAPMVIGSTPADADDGARAIMAGEKTATSSPRWAFPDGRIPFVGALSVVLDGARRPVGIVETTRVEIAPFGSADEAFAAAYGEGERTLAWWRREIGAWYRAEAARAGEAFDDDTPIIKEWFVVVARLRGPS